jgi:chromosome segregation ATPase
MGIKQFIIKFFKINQKVEVITPIDQELATKDSQIKALLKDNQSKSGEISKIKAEKRKQKDLISENEEQQQKFEEIKRKQSILDSEKFENALSLKNLFEYMFKHPKFSIDIMDRDMSVKFAEFDDLVIFNDGELGILDKNKDILSKGKMINQIFYKPSGLKTQINKRLIRLPCDKNFGSLPDFEEIQMPEVIYDPIKGKIMRAKFSHKPFGQLVKDREETINEYAVMLQEKEESIAKLVKSNRGYQRNLSSLDSKYKVAETEMSVMNNRYTSMYKKFKNLQSKLSESQSMRTLAENIKNKYKDSLNELSSLVADKLGKTDTEAFMDKVKDIVDWIDEKKPMVQTVQQIKQPEPNNGG